MNMSINIPETDSMGKHFYYAPPPTDGSGITTGTPLGVYLGDDEEVEWIWQHGTHGSHVMGYNIRKRVSPTPTPVPAPVTTQDNIIV